MRRFFAALLLSGFSLSATAADRVVSVGGAVTEIAFALGAGDRLVAIDSTSTWPPEADRLPDVGYMRQLSAEPIVAMRPDLVIAVEGSGPESALAQLRSAGVRVETVTDEHTEDGVAAKIEQVAGLLGREGEGAALAARARAGMAAVRRRVDATTERPRVLFLLSAGRGAALAAGRETAAAAIIGLAGAVNAVDGYAGYKALSPEAAVAAAPDYVLAMPETVAALGGPERLLALPELRATPGTKVVTMDGILLLGFGPRTPEALQQLAAMLHPGMKRSD